MPPLILRPLWAVLVALLLLVAWLGLIAYRVGSDGPAMLSAIGESARRCALPGLAARAHLLAANWHRVRLAGMDRSSRAGQELIRRLMAERMAAARMLLQAGYVGAAEGLALESARADFDDIEARALLLETRLQGAGREAARRELMLLLLRREHPQVLYLLGRSFAEQGRQEDAEAFYQRALELEPAHFPTLLGMADLQIDRRDRTGAMSWAGKADGAAKGPEEKLAVQRSRATADASAVNALSTVKLWLTEHGGTLGFAGAYLVLLFLPRWWWLVRGR